MSLVETEAFARTIRRRKAYLTEAGRLKWAKFATPVGAPIDDLFAHNVSLVRSLTKRPAMRRSLHDRCRAGPGVQRTVMVSPSSQAFCASSTWPARLGASPHSRRAWSPLRNRSPAV